MGATFPPSLIYYPRNCSIVDLLQQNIIDIIAQKEKLKKQEKHMKAKKECCCCLDNQYFEKSSKRGRKETTSRANWYRTLTNDPMPDDTCFGRGRSPLLSRKLRSYL